MLQYIVRIIQLFVIDKQVIIMLKNNIEVDVKVKCIENEKTQAELAKEISITPSYVNRLIRKKWKCGQQNIFSNDGSIGVWCDACIWETREMIFVKSQIAISQKEL